MEIKSQSLALWAVVSHPVFLGCFQLAAKILTSEAIHVLDNPLLQGRLDLEFSRSS